MLRSLFHLITAAWLCIIAGSEYSLAQPNNQTNTAFPGHSAYSEILTRTELAYLQQLPVLRVPVIDNQPPLTFIENGQPQGYLNELMVLIAERLGIRIEFFVANYADSILAVQNGSADMLSDYSSYGDRSDFLLETQPVLVSPFVVIGQSGAEPVRKLDELLDKRVVMVRGFQQTRTLQARHPDLKLMLVDSIDAAYRAIRSKEAEYYIDNATHAGYYLRHHMISDLEIVSELPPDEIGRLKLHFAVSSKHPLLFSAVEKTLDRLMQNKEHQKLKARWLEPPTTTQLKLTASERRWLSEHPEVRVVLDPDWAPVEYRTEAGNYEGISLDYLARIEELLNINIKIVNNLSWQEAVNAIKSKQADMLASVSRTQEREKFMLFTQPYIEMPIRIFAKDDISYIGDIENLHGKRIAVVAGYAVHDWISNDYPQLQLVSVKTPAEGLRMVADGTVDVFIGNVVTATYYMGKHKIKNVREAGETPYSNNQTIAVRNDWPEFVSILQKALEAIPQHERKAIYNRWMSIKFEHEADYTILLWVTLSAALLLLLVFYWNRILKQQVLNRTRALAETESRFRNFFEKNSSVLLIIEPQSGEIVEANQSAVAYYGYQRDKLVGMSIDSINITSADDDSKSQQQKNEPTEKNFSTFKHRLANGEERDVDAYSTPIVSNNRQLLFTIIHDVTERKRAEALIEKQAHYDALTGLPNRVLALDRLDKLLHQADRTNTRNAVIFIDLDDFKKINDTLGHDVGDVLLVEAALRIRNSLREVDTVGRLGGDEFIVLVGALAEPADIIPVAEKILDCFNKPFFIQSRELILTASIGIAVYPDDGDNTLALLRNADSAMYHAKENGRNMFAFFTKAMNTCVSRRLNVEEQMNGALERGEFHLCYQPKISIDSGTIIGVEALLRWNNPMLGMISPDEFIPVAEQTGLILPIGEFVLTESLATLVRIHEQFGPHISMAVNLSPRQFRDRQLVKFIEKSVHDANVPWHSLEFEITEGVLMLGLGYIEEAISFLSEKGAVLAMDDFGTGYSSLSYLRQFPFNVLKIDRSFIADIANNQHDLELVNAIIAMAHSLGLQVVAEGVETVEQAAILSRQRCDIAQGYLFGKPVPVQELFKQISHNQQRKPHDQAKSS